MKQLPRKTLAGCVILDDQGRLLLLHRNTSRLIQWEIPGGKQEEQEPLEETARRETREEVGVDVTITRTLGDAAFEHRDIMWDYHWFEAEINLGQQPEIMEPETFDSLRYWSLKDIRNEISIMSPNIANLLKKIDV